MAAQNKKDAAYGNESITSLKGADRVRKRPGVMFGSDGIEGCEHAVFEIISNSIDEARDGYGDKIIVKKQETANNGDIVVALIDDSATVKRFYSKDGKIILHPENDLLDDIILDSVEILGIVKGLTRKF